MMNSIIVRILKKIIFNAPSDDTLKLGIFQYRLQDSTVNMVAAHPMDVPGTPCDRLVVSPVSKDAAAVTPTAAVLVSPYHTVTSPRTPTRRTDSQCSSSDISSSVVSGPGARRSSDGDKLVGGTSAGGGFSRKSRDANEASSGYESMMRDSEEVTSNQEDSTNEDGQSTSVSLATRLKGTRTFRKRGRPYSLYELSHAAISSETEIRNCSSPSALLYYDCPFL